MASTTKVCSDLHDPAEVASTNSDGPYRTRSTSWYKDGKMPRTNDSYLEVYRKLGMKKWKPLLLISIMNLIRVNLIRLMEKIVV